MNDTDWRRLAAGLAETVARKVRLSPQWRAAFEEVPRHHFVSGAPLQKVYADEPIVIQRDDEDGSDRADQLGDRTEPLGLYADAPPHRERPNGPGDRHRQRLQHRAADPSTRLRGGRLQGNRQGSPAGRFRYGSVGSDTRAATSTTETAARSSAPASPSTGSSPPSVPAAFPRRGASSSTPMASS